jgi:uncharacterized BrkB/YihY/UPF0761 family membrane protein
MQEIKRVNVMSAFRLGLVLYLFLGLVFSILVLIFGAGVVGSVPFASRFGQLGAGILGVIIGTLVYGVVGALMWAAVALAYNVIPKKIGGIKVEIV